MNELALEVDDVTTTQLNEEIITIKKKIQLSEGQRKAQYEEYDSEKKKNIEGIRRLKTEIKQLTASKPSDLDEELMKISGQPVKKLKEYLNKPQKEVARILDLKNIDLQKKLDLIKYEIIKKQEKILDITKKMEDILMETDQQSIDRFAAPIQKEVSRLENKIHLVNVNILELRHMQKKYLTIRQSLLEDRVYFESTLKKTEENMARQHVEIKRLQVVKFEAVRLRDKTRNELAKLEAEVVADGFARETELQQLRKKVEEGKAYLERVERSLVPSIKTISHQDSSDENLVLEAEEIAAKETMEKAIAKMKQVTGAKDEEDIIRKFNGQRETKERLIKLKEVVEKEKRELERKKERLENELEALKFAQVKEKEQNEEELERLKTGIEQAKDQLKKVNKTCETDKRKLLNIKSYLCRICEMIEKPGFCQPCPEGAVTDLEIDDLLIVTKTRLTSLMKLVEDNDLLEELLLDHTRTDESLGVEEETKIEKRGESSSGVGGGDKEGATSGDKGGGAVEMQDIPTRSFLKRQSQLIVEAKTRRKGYVREPISAFK